MSRASEQAYTKIRGLILSGNVLPGRPLTETGLAEAAGVSRTPVREALRRLEAELYVARTKSQRLFVADWSRDDIDEMFTLRAMLESHAAGRAALRIGPESLAELAAASDAVDDAVRANPPDIAKFVAENRRFHQIFIDAAASPRLAAMLTALVEQPIVLRTATHYSVDELQRSARDHGELVQALTARDTEWARSVMTAHILRASHAFAAAMPGQLGAEPISAK